MSLYYRLRPWLLTLLAAAMVALLIIAAIGCATRYHVEYRPDGTVIVDGQADKLTVFIAPR